MARFLANENVPIEAVDEARRVGFDLEWIREIMPGADDDAVLARSIAEQRVLVTFDKDFGDMAFRQGKSATYGVILMRPRLRAPDYVSRFVIGVLSQPIHWEGLFCVAREGRLRTVPLPP
jgi:predicted nuclease of predicted toxin-antitoxin system